MPVNQEADQQPEDKQTTPYTLRLPSELHRKLKAEAVLRNITINDLIEQVLALGMIWF